MRRGVGVAGLQKAAAAREQYRSMGDEVKKSNQEAMREQMALFKAKLEEFAMQHKADIRRDPEFRAKFHQMCANIGVDPLASNKGMWAKTLGFGDFYYELAVQVVEACWASRTANGGMFELGALTRVVNKRRGSRADPVTPDDLVRAIKKLRVLGGGFDVVTVGAVQYVRSVPGELNLDTNNVLQVAQASGYTSLRELKAKLSWTDMRLRDVLQGLLSDGLAMIDDGAPGGERLYWFPCHASMQTGAQAAVASAPLAAS